MSRSRNYCFTINNYTDSDIEDCYALQEKSNYLIVGCEVGEQGTPHLQGYVNLKTSMSMKALSKKLRRAYLAESKGDALSNKNYCSKEKVLIEYGNIPKQGKRTDIEKIRDILEETPGNPLRECIKNATSLQSIKIAEKYLTYFEKPRVEKPQVLWFHGPTGTGKSKEAHSIMEDKYGDNYYVANETNKWWDGYDAHEGVIIDDMRKDFTKFHVLLRLLDRYAYRVEIKGGYRQFKAKTIIITSCYSPQEMYQNRFSEDLGQLLRRIDKIQEFSNFF